MNEEKLPKGWKKTSFKKIVRYKKGKKPKILTDIEFENSIPYLDIKALELGEIRRYADFESSNLLDSNSIAIVWDGARSGWVSKGVYGAMGSTIAALTPILVNVDYTYHFLRSQFEKLNSSTRGTGIPHVNPDVLWNIQIPLPPLPEQQLIVAKLDALFRHLDSLREKLDRIPELLKNFRQQVLTHAVTGELTRVKMEIVPLGEYLEDIKYGTSKKSEYKVEGVPILRIPNIDVDKGLISISNMKYSKLDNKEYEKLKLKEGDILIIRSNGSVSLVGQSAVIQEDEIDFAYAGYLVRLRTVNGLLPKFLNYMLKSSFLRSQIVETARSTSGVNNINTTEIKSLQIPLTSVENQRAIIDRIELLFDLTDKIESQYQSLKGKIDQLPQAILAKAFRGDLVEREVKAYEVEEGVGLIAAEGKAGYGERSL